MRARDFFASLPVHCFAFTVRLFAHDKEDVVEIRVDASRIERSVALLEDDDDNVVTQVTLSFDLLRITFRERQLGGDVEHNRVVLELGEITVFASHALLYIQTTIVRLPALEFNLVGQKLQKFCEIGARVIFHYSTLALVICFRNSSI